MSENKESSKNLTMTFEEFSELADPDFFEKITLSKLSVNKLLNSHLRHPLIDIVSDTLTKMCKASSTKLYNQEGFLSHLVLDSETFVLSSSILGIKRKLDISIPFYKGKVYYSTVGEVLECCYKSQMLLGKDYASVLLSELSKRSIFFNKIYTEGLKIFITNQCFKMMDLSKGFDLGDQLSIMNQPWSKWYGCKPTDETCLFRNLDVSEMLTCQKVACCLIFKNFKQHIDIPILLDSFFYNLMIPVKPASILFHLQWLTIGFSLSRTDCPMITSSAYLNKLVLTVGLICLLFSGVVVISRDLNPVEWQSIEEKINCCETRAVDFQNLVENFDSSVDFLNHLYTKLIVKNKAIFPNKQSIKYLYELQLNGNIEFSDEESFFILFFKRNLMNSTPVPDDKLMPLKTPNNVSRKYSLNTEAIGLMSALHCNSLFKRLLVKSFAECCTDEIDSVEKLFLITLFCNIEQVKFDNTQMFLIRECNTNLCSFKGNWLEINKDIVERELLNSSFGSFDHLFSQIKNLNSFILIRFYKNLVVIVVKFLYFEFPDVKKNSFSKNSKPDLNLSEFKSAKNKRLSFLKNQFIKSELSNELTVNGVLCDIFTYLDLMSKGDTSLACVHVRRTIKGVYRKIYKQIINCLY